MHTIEIIMENITENASGFSTAVLIRRVIKKAAKKSGISINTIDTISWRLISLHDLHLRSLSQINFKLVLQISHSILLAF